MALLDEGEVLLAGLLDNVSLYVGLCTSLPGQNDTLATITEISDSNYSRKAITLGEVVTEADGSYRANTNTITFDFAEYSGQIAYYFITDVQSGTAGSLIFGDQLSRVVSVEPGDSIRFPAGGIKIKVSQVSQS